MTPDPRLADVAGIMIPTWVSGVLQPYDKLAAHVEGLRHKAVSVFVMAGDKVLIQQRAAHKYHTPTLWANTCCTHPTWGEDVADCAARRLEEELGISGLTTDYRGHVTYRADVGGGLIEHEEVEVFVAQADEAMQFTPNPNEVMAVAWVRYDDLIKQVNAQPAKFTPWLRIYLEKHRDMIFGVAA